MTYTVELVDENGNGARFQTEDWSGIEFLSHFIAAAAATQDYRPFKNDGALLVLDSTGAEVARADRSTAWSLPDDPKLKRDRSDKPR